MTDDLWGKGEVSGIENGNGNRSGSGSGCEQGKKKEEQPPPVARKTAECDRQRERGAVAAMEANVAL